MAVLSGNLEEFMKAKVADVLVIIDPTINVYIYNLPLETTGSVASVVPTPGAVNPPLRAINYTVRIRAKDEASGKALIEAVYAAFMDATFSAPTVYNDYKIESEAVNTPQYEGTDEHGQATYSLAVELTTII